MILMIDNYDSFTYNLVQYLMMLKEEVVVVRNDAIDIAGIRALNPEVIVLSPGPCTPSESGVCKAVLDQLKADYPILGICLGHQAIAQAFGGEIIKAIRPVHGKVSAIKHDGRGVFKDLNQPLQVTRYHSLVVNSENLPECLEVSAVAEDGQIMGLRHKHYKIEGVQFHPEAILTEQGHELLLNFLKQAREKTLEVQL